MRVALRFLDAFLTPGAKATRIDPVRDNMRRSAIPVFIPRGCVGCVMFASHPSPGYKKEHESTRAAIRLRTRAMITAEDRPFVAAKITAIASPSTR